MKRYEELPAYLGGWDVGIMPFAHNDATRYISPTKTPEYLAAGLRVVSTSIHDVVEPYGRNGSRADRRRRSRVPRGLQAGTRDRRRRAPPQRRRVPRRELVGPDVGLHRHAHRHGARAPVAEPPDPARPGRTTRSPRRALHPGRRSHARRGGCHGDARFIGLAPRRRRGRSSQRQVGSGRSNERQAGHVTVPIDPRGHHAAGAPATRVTNAGTLARIE